MAYDRKPGDGTLWKNNKKREGKKDPDSTGDALIHCPQCSLNFEVWLNGWTKQKADGEKFVSLNIKSKQDPGAGPERPAQQRPVPARHAPPPPPPKDAAPEDHSMNPDEPEIPF